MQKHVDRGFRLVAMLFGIVLVLVLWHQHPGLIVGLLDANLFLIKLACSVVPGSYGAMAESALRVGLGADKALLFLEGRLFVQGVLFTLRRIIS